MKQLLAIALLAGQALLPPAAAAQSNAYLSMTGSFSTFELELQDPSGFSYRALTPDSDQLTDLTAGFVAGYRFNEYVGIEAGYHILGQHDTSFTYYDYSGDLGPRLGAVDLEFTAATAGVVLTAPAWSEFSFFFKLGAMAYDYESTLVLVTSRNRIVERADGTELFLGFGGQWQLNPDWGLGFEWLYYDIDDFKYADDGVLSFHATYNFARPRQPKK